MVLQRTVFQKLVILSFGLYIIAADLEIVHNSVNWIKAREDCIKKGGKLSTEEFGSCKDKTKGNKIWIGTHQILSPWLGKIGCFNLGNATSKQSITGSVQECYSLCGKRFGFINIFCFCNLRMDIKPITNSRCLTSNPSYKRESTIAWIYESNELDISNVDDLQNSGNCVGLRCSNMSSVLEVCNCSSAKQYFCQNGTHSTRHFSWKGAERFCNNNITDFSVTNHEHLCNNTNDDGHKSGSYWTGYKRYWYKSTPNMSSESIRSLSEVFNCSYMTCQNDAATAQHQQGNCSQELNGYACMINMVPQTTSIEESSMSIIFTIRTKNQTTREPNTDTSNYQHRGHVTSKQIVSSRESGTTITSGTLEKLVKKPSYTVLILVLTIVAVGIISSGVVLAICRVRRQGPFKRKEQEPGSQMTEMHDPNYHDFETAPHNAPSMLQSNTAYNTHTSGSHVLSDQTSVNIQSGTASKNEYSVVVKDNKSSTGANDDNFDQKEENSSDIMDNEYDRLNQIRIPSDNNNSKNIYDSSSGLRDEYDPTYNISSQISGRNKDDNAVYDHV